ncbi:hypothetical protein IMSHALPRED_003979 [Imshaugia aleurites]|uniref:ribonuclease H n=1 Tax=Imshaugia aleurites TaxID=172621 RepID=A0A8H3EMX5_9LECA|nr:hypothetical protein IMSHALPRED_003979 [Imshaugia aleurites]
MSTSHGEEGVIDRKVIFCDRLQAFETHELIKTCPECHDFFLYCCHCSMESRVNNEPRPCHHFRLVFTDGACRLNGQVGATAGIGIAYGEETGSQRATSITSLSDPGQKRTSQRAELLAALAGLRVLGAAHQLNEKESVKTEAKSRRSQDSKEKVWVIATDSEYVVKGMTEWLPSWKNNNLRTNRNTKPANLDLFVKLDAEITAQETVSPVKVGFWHVPREHNAIADALAKEASLRGDLE